MTRSPGKVDALRAAGAEPVVADGLDRDAVAAAVTARRAGRRPAPDDRPRGRDELQGLRRGARGDEPAADRGHRHPARGRPRRGRARGRAELRAVALRRAGPAARRGRRADRSRPAGLDGAHRERRPLPRVGGHGRGRHGPALRLVLRPRHRVRVHARDAADRRRRRRVVVHPHRRRRAPRRSPRSSAARRASTTSPTTPPVPIGEWLPRLAPEPPARLSEADGLPVIGEAMVHLHTRIEGLSNAKARRELDWAPPTPASTTAC